MNLNFEFWSNGLRLNSTSGGIGPLLRLTEIFDDVSFFCFCLETQETMLKRITSLTYWNASTKLQNTNIHYLLVLSAKNIVQKHGHWHIVCGQLSPQS